MPAQLLVAESDSVLRGLYAAYFRAIGFEVETADDGLRCLDLLREDRHDALVIDMDLRWGGGDGVLSWLAGDESHRPRAVVALGSSTPAELSLLLGLPERDCLQKPAHASSLVVRLATQLFTNQVASVAQIVPVS
ncbi:response regulator [Tautonia plasticadhaerens]|uniref:Response regulator of RpoS n=1 Tax=Tautonia plasticadhaerens TaxID=2527974 RepID=A0A518H309_9BACT|nr:response regulator [Tautonia plasticadhaerens]QDV35224.1 response regulator of RpoS [Tautonia plasticadhaerens]